MNSNYELKLNQFILDHHIAAEHFTYTTSCHSVEDAAKAADAPIDAFVKNICMIDEQDRLIVGIVKGTDRACTSRAAKALELPNYPRLATSEEILNRTGYPYGGTPSFGFTALFLVDPTVMDTPIIYTGGGSEYSLVKILPTDLIKANNGQIVRIRK